MKFTNYTAALPQPAVDGCIHVALEHAIVTHAYDMGALIGTNEVVYRFENVVLELQPGRAMSWRIWASAAIALKTFVTVFEPVGFGFEVLVGAEAMGEGVGVLRKD